MLLFLFAEIAARSSELEVIVYNDTTGVDMVAQQYQTPTSESWPKNYSVLARELTKKGQAAMRSSNASRRTKQLLTTATASRWNWFFSKPR